MSDESELKQVTIYTDGGCIGNPGPGGYGVVLLYGDKRRELSGGFRLTTNNRMEIMAAIVGLETLRFRCAVTIYTDSKYLADTITNGWAIRWRANGWKRTAKEPAVNADLWARLLDLCELHQVQFQWVKGHAGNPENERCDRLSVQAAQSRDLPPDDGYRETAPSPALLSVPNPVAKQAAPVPNASQAVPSGARRKITEEGQPCRRCGTPVVRRTPTGKRKPQQEYYYEYYLYCPQCHDMYMVEAAKRFVR